MRTVGWMLSGLIVLGSLGLMARAAGSDGEEGFVSLFNGKDLTGWVYGSKSGEGYQVKDGVLYCTVKDGGNLYTEKEYGDFVYRFEFKLTPSANNGIAIRAPLKGNAAYLGMEIQVLDDTGDKYKNPDGSTKLRPEQFHGSIYDLVAAKQGHQKPVGEWNEEEIIAKGRQITVKLNGMVIVDANLDDIKDEAKIKKHPGLANKTGHIGFAGHGAQVEFRKMRVKELK